MLRSRRPLVLVGLTLLGCPKSPPGDGDETGGPLECVDLRETIDVLPLSANRDVDILFVIDNSSSMAAAQTKLAAGVDALIEVLEREDVDANYRIGVTTTDNGNPWCSAAETTPEAGELVMSSCTSRLADFVSTDGVDAQSLACTEPCELDGPLTILPTATSVDPTPSPRPWIERIEGLTNLEPGVDPVAALRCALPQGVDGCGFEAPLDSMYLALHRAQSSEEGSYGFLRASAVLVLVLVTDEADCSYSDEWSAIFAEDGGKAFWSDPDAASPSSALCWNAGVVCEGDPSGYDSCEPVNKGIDGTLDVFDGDAVLRPMSRYVGQVEALEQEKQTLNADREVIVAVIGGVTGNGEDWSVAYADASDPEFQTEYGIGPGCTDADGGFAIPPVRLRDFAESMDSAPGRMYSICEPDLGPALADIGERIGEQMPPACYRQCVADLDPDTAVLDAQCTVEQHLPGGGIDNVEPLPECAREADGRYAIDPETNDYVMPSGDANACFAMLVDPDGSVTSDPNDDMSPECTEAKYNLEFVIERRRGFPAPDGTALVPTCTLACFAEVECPGIGG